MSDEVEIPYCKLCGCFIGDTDLHDEWHAIVPPTDSEIVIAFLDSLDPDQLEKDALAGMGMGEGNVVQSVIDRMYHIAKGWG